MTEKVFLAATGNCLTRAEFTAGKWNVTEHLQGQQINCLAKDPDEAQRVIAGSQDHGLWISENSGRFWENSGKTGFPIKSLVIRPRNSRESMYKPNTIYAGCKPVSLFSSQDGGKTWVELVNLRKARRFWWFSPAEPPDWSPYVIALALSPTNPNIILAGIEVGGVLRSEDGGKSWSKHKRGAQLDCHSLKFHHKQGEYIYQGGGSGPALSTDGGITWRQPKNGLGKKYGWMVAADPERPEVWYLSASYLPNLLRGEFTPSAHKDGNANAYIYRSVGGAPWERLSSGLPSPLPHMAYALLTDPHSPGHLYAGLANGDVWHTENYGDAWSLLPFNLGKIHTSMIMI